jgi:hypothetical protein
VCELAAQSMMGENKNLFICMLTMVEWTSIFMRIFNMGINGLLPFVKKYNKECNLRIFSGQTAAINASCWIHKALCVSIDRTGSRER